MNTQELFDIQWEYFNRPGAELALKYDDGYALTGICMYRTPDGKKCAVGCAIPDELYRPRMDEDGGLPVTALIDDYQEVGELFDDVDIEYLYASQATHDDAQSVEEFLNELKVLASEYNLEIPSERS